MAIGVTGWYDDKTRIATGTLQELYGINNANDSVFGRNTWRAMDSIITSPDRIVKYTEFIQKYKANCIELGMGEFTFNLAGNMVIFGFGKPLLTSILPEATVTVTPLGSGLLPTNLANTFRSTTYTMKVTNKPTILYRVWGGEAGELGVFWSKTPPTGAYQAAIDGAILPEWGNTLANVTKIRVPAGVTIYEGAAAGQGALVGGGSQVILLEGVRPWWIIP